MNIINLIVSITSWPPRFNQLKKCLQSICNQQCKIKFKIILTLTNDDYKSLSKELKQFLDENSIEILLCDKNIRAHKKYFYVMKKYKDIPIITVDDDCIYDKFLIEKLYSSYKQFPKCVHATRTRLMKFKDNKLDSYDTWKYIDKFNNINNPNILLFPVGVGGVLYPPNIIDIDSVTDELIDTYITNDDFLLKYQTLLKQIKVRNIECEKMFTETESTNINALWQHNKYQNQKYIDVFNSCPNILESLKL